MRYRILLLALLLLFNISSKSQEKTDYSEAFPFIEAWLQAQVAYEDIPGISAIAVKDQEVLWKGAFGYANKEQQLSASTETLYSICSISKLFTSIAVMQLYEEGKLRLDDEIDEILPWYNLKQKYPESGPITIRTLLTHSSGLPRESNHSYWSGPDFIFPSSEEVRTELENQETLYPASTYFQYSNLGMTLLGEVIAQVSGQSYEDYIRTHILEPLDLNSTTPFIPKEKFGMELSVPYSAHTRDRERMQLPLFDAKGIAAAAGFSSNVEDMAKFAAWQMRLLDSTEFEILKPSTLKYMQNVHYVDPEWNPMWGLGFSIGKNDKGNKVVGHGGSCPGYRATFSLIPEDNMAMSAMINAGGVSPEMYARGIKSLLEKFSIAKKDVGEDQTQDLSSYVGLYNVQPWGSEVYIGIKGNELAIMALPTDDPASILRLKHIEGDIFRRVRSDGSLGETHIFERDKEGKVYRVTRNNNFSLKLD